MKIILSILLSLPISIFASELLQNFPILKEGESVIKTRIGLTYEDRAYEKDDVEIDSVSTEGIPLSLSYETVLWKKHIFGIELEYLIDGEYEETYQGELEGIPDIEVGSKGFKEPLFHYTHWFKHNINPNFHHSLYLFYRPKIFNPDSEDYAKGRHEGGFEYRYNYRYPTHGLTLSGSVYTHIFSKAEIEASNGLEDTIGSYTEVGFDVRPGYVWEKFSLHLLGGYTSTTDYNSKNQSFERLSDKGFSWILGAQANYLLSKKQALKFDYWAKDLVFNSIEEDVSRDIEYEIVEMKFLISWWVKI